MRQSGQTPEFIQLLLLLFFAAILIYFFPIIISKLLFLMVLPIAWKSKRDYFWLAFFFVMLDYPGGFFHGGEREDLFRLPFYSIMPGISFGIQELFFILMFMKVLVKKKYYINNSSSFFKNEIKALAFLFVILLAISPLLGMSVDSLHKVYKLTIGLSLFYSTFRLIYSKEQLMRFFRIIFPFSFMAMLLIVYSLIFKQQLVALVKPGVTATQGIFDVSRQFDRPVEMVHILFIGFSGSLFLLAYAKHNFNRYYLVFVNLLSFLGLFLTATRTWFLAFSTGYLLFFLFSLKSKKKYLRYALIIVLLVFVIFSSIPQLRNQSKDAWSRIETTEKLFEGDLTAGGTLKRFDIRAPKVMEGFWSSSIILGAGFSDHFYKYADGHLGYHNILLNSGIIGAIIFFLVILKILTVPFRLAKKYTFLNKPFLKISIIPLIMLLIINVGTQTIGFTPDGVTRVFLMAFAVLLPYLVVKDSENQIILKQ